ncbi:MAG: metE [Elusimicrobia bacterium]|nr:MAG: metE [Elusimicrobiota bacterium]
MPIPTEPVGSLPRSKDLSGAAAVKDVIARLEALGSPVVTDGEQTKPSFVTYPLAGLALSPEGVVIPFADGHTRRLPVLAQGPFRYGVYADSYLLEAKKHAKVPVKQAVIAVSAMSLLYPPTGLPGYSREQFVADLVAEGENAASTPGPIVSKSTSPKAASRSSSTPPAASCASSSA